MIRPSALSASTPVSPTTAAVVGAPFADGPGGTDSGAVYLFRGEGRAWSQTLKLTAPDAAAYDKFGSSVVIDGDTIAVYAPGADTSRGMDAGRTYVFVDSPGGWVLQQQIEVGDSPKVSYRGGGQLALEGDTLVVGTGYEDVADVRDAGAVHILTRSGLVWTEQARLTEAVPVAGNNLGSALALDGDTLIASSPHARVEPPGSGKDGGTATIFHRTGGSWAVQSRLTPVTQAYDICGLSVAVRGDTAVIGCGYDDTGSGGRDAGSVVVYDRADGVWTQITRLYSPLPRAYALFGRSVALASGGLAVGANIDRGPGGASSGAVYVFPPREES